MQLVFTAMNILEAHIVAGLLESEGIKAFVSGDYLQGAVGDLPATDFSHVYVCDDDVTAAKAIINQYENNQIV